MHVIMGDESATGCCGGGGWWWVVGGGGGGGGDDKVWCFYTKVSAPQPSPAAPVQALVLTGRLPGGEAG